MTKILMWEHRAITPALFEHDAEPLHTRPIDLPHALQRALGNSFLQQETGTSAPAINVPGLTCPLRIQRACACGGACVPGARSDENKARTLQPKLMIGSPDDVYEQEADRVAEHVMRMPERQSECACGGGRPKYIQKHGSHEQLQTKSFQTDDAGGADILPVIREIPSSLVIPLDPATRNFMETRFGADFSQVRIHTGPRAEDSTRAIQARAFTLERDIVFGAGQYAPDTAEGRKLLAHELTHVLQQRRSADAANTVKPSMLQRACRNFPDYLSPGIYCQTEEEARASIIHACPPHRDCFLYRDGPPTHPWRPVAGHGTDGQGFGCAHHVAHILGIRNGRTFEKCLDGFSVTIGQITSGRVQHPLAEAQVNDIWSSGVHSGVVTQVDAMVPRVRVDQCGISGNAQPVWFNHGNVYR